MKKRQSDYNATLAKSDRAGPSEAFVVFMLEAMRGSILPFAKPADGRGLELSRALGFLRGSPKAAFKC